MSWLMNLIFLLIATAVVAWVFRFAGQKFIGTCQWPVCIHSIPHSSGQFNFSVRQPFGQRHTGLFSITLCAFSITLVHCHKFIPSQGCWRITQHRALGYGPLQGSGNCSAAPVI